MTHRSRSKNATLAAAVLVLVLAACGSDSDSDGEATGSEDELTTVTVGGLPILPTVGLQYGIDEGIFEEHGLDIQLETSQSGAALIPSVVAGEYDFGTSNSVSVMIALDAGLPLQVTSGFVNALPEGDDITGVYTLPDSGIETPADLAGRSVAVSTLNSVGTVTVREVVRRHGGDPDTIEFVELGYPDMPAALESGQVDAMWNVEPFLTAVEQTGAQLVSWNFQELAPGVSTMVMVAAADQDPELIERFNAALDDVLTQVEADEEGLRATIPSVLDLDPEIVETVRIERFATEVDTSLLQVFADLVYQDELVSEPVDITEFEN